MDGVQLFNAIEAGWWTLVALAVCLSRMPVKTRWARWALATVLLLFGLSDVVEIWTGAWWRPWWLGVWKGACVVGIGVLVVTIMRDRRMRSSRPPCEKGEMQNEKVE